MKKLQVISRKSLVYWCIATAFIGYSGVQVIIVTGYTPLIIHPVNALVFVGTAIVLALYGRAVLKLKDHQETWLTHDKAGYVVVFAQACLYFSAIMAGFMGSQLVAGIMRYESPVMFRLAIGAGACFVAAIVLGLVASSVEKWCIVDDDGDEDYPSQDKGPSGVANPA
ncbi:MAG: DUF3180 family protein [Actinomycetaceae bacterium]|nr:DUF3180 family protein [Actinomycetaceae bacterium]